MKDRASDSLASQPFAPFIPLALLGGFAVVLAAFGGSSRADPMQVIFLRPLAALFLIPAFFLSERPSWKSAKALVYLFCIFAMWTALQLVPVPPEIWQTLPDRDAIGELDHLTGLGDVWRPLSMAPTRGMNALVSLVVPFAALALALASRTTSTFLLHVILVIGLANSALGFLQIATGPNSIYYLYMYVAPRSAAGLFANENHSTIFSVIMLLIISRLVVEMALSGAGNWRWMRIFYPTSFAFILLSVLVTGSRAGFAALIVALSASAIMAWQFARAPEAFRGTHLRQRDASGSKKLTALLGLFALALTLVFLLQGRTPAMQDILDRNAIDDLRWQILPILWDMAKAHWLLGSGFGSFESVYQAYEPTELLMVAYVNQAHNDWLQIVMEGGLPACLMLGSLITWIIHALMDIKRSGPTLAGRVLFTFWSASFLIIGAASVVDYPLRTPIFQAMGVWLLFCMILDKGRSRGAQASGF